jgi:hypothetical protein
VIKISAPVAANVSLPIAQTPPSAFGQIAPVLVSQSTGSLLEKQTLRRRGCLIIMGGFPVVGEECAGKFPL